MRLLSEVHPSKLQNSGASGSEARLRVNSPEGQREIAALRDLKQSSSLLRVVNSQELGIQALSKLNLNMDASLDALMANPEVTPSVMEQLTALQGSIKTATTATTDLRYGNSHLASCAISQYTDAIKERQNAWLKSSNLPAPLQSEIAKLDLAMPQGSSTEPLSILGPRAEKLVEDHYNQRKDDFFP